MADEMFFTDDAAMLRDILLREWDTGIGNTPPITFDNESYMVNARTGAINIQRMTRTNNIRDTDYRSFDRHSYLSVKISNRDRATHFKWCEEFYRIFMKYRRAGPSQLNGWTYMEISAERPTPDLGGWYTNVFDLRFTKVHKGIPSSGFGNIPEDEQPTCGHQEQLPFNEVK